MALTITAFFAGILALWLVALQVRVARYRGRHQILVGTGGSQEAEKMIRAHGNAVESIPIFLILLGLGEGLGAPGWVLVLIAVAFTIGRLLHGLYFMGVLPGLVFRVLGMMLTILPIALMSLGLIAHGLGG